MLIQAPGISGSKLCKFLGKNKLNFEDLNLPGTCQDVGDFDSETWGGELSASQREQIYAVWFSNLDTIEETFKGVFSLSKSERAQKFAKILKADEMEFNAQFDENIQIVDTELDAENNSEPIDGELESTAVQDMDELSRPETLNQIAREFPNEAANEATKGVPEIVVSELHSKFETLVKKLPPEKKIESPRRNDQSYSAKVNLSPIEFERVKREAIDAAILAISDPDNLAEIVHPSREEALEIILAMESPDSVVTDIVAVYSSDWNDVIEDAAVKYLNENGVAIQSIKNNLLNLKKSIIWSNLPRYSAAAAIRILIVFFTVLALSFLLLGKYTTSAFSVGGAFAAFLLVWPLILLWDVAVNLEWKSLRVQFFIIYCFYIGAFFFTARAAALSATSLRKNWGKSLAPLDNSNYSRINTTFKELASNVFVALVFHVISFGAGILIPLNSNG